MDKIRPCCRTVSTHNSRENALEDFFDQSHHPDLFSSQRSRTNPPMTETKRRHLLPRRETEKEGDREKWETERNRERER